jgi:hypothetical protein
MHAKIKETDDNENFRDDCEAQEALARKLDEKVEASKERLKDDRAERDEAVLALRRMAGERLDRPLLDSEEDGE